MVALPLLPTARRRPTEPSRARPQLPSWMIDVDDGGEIAASARTRYRTIFVSDSHLGTAGANATLLLDFLKRHECETLYLVGDIVDGWQLRKGWYWPQTHSDVVRAVLKMAKHGTRVIYVPGNHDEHFRDYVGLEFGGIELIDDDVHVTADGRRLLVIHGDQFDNVVLYHKWLAFLGDGAYTLLIKSNRWVNRCRRLFGLPYWSLAAHMKKRVKNAVAFISRFEEVVAHAAAERGVDGVVCGHIHSAEIRQFGPEHGGITYYNDGDWVESCTALVEEADGAMRIVDWAEHVRLEDIRKLSRPRLIVAEPLPALGPALGPA
jgi:UDP-2,3-diacylglucosamine pyrophosphatase LpxH